MKQEAIIKTVRWKDLTHLSRKDVIIENTITLPWLIASWILAYKQLYGWAVPCSVMFFLTALRQVHNGFHHSLSVSKKMTWLSLYINSLLMLISSHAVKFNHLRHHKYYPGPEDHEGKCAQMKWYRAILHGPQHVWDIHAVTWRLGNKFYRRDLILEISSVMFFTAVAFYIGSGFLIYHIVAMTAGEFFSAFFAVWTVHHDLDENVIARTQRKRWKNIITYNMFYHLEHHLFPAVPAIKLKELADRIDQAFPSIEKKSTF